ncbi:leucine-rich repeat neuronal protein 3-like isoform X1 [Anopheles stephensi]|uniref:leucine-rich repeat neuronal protein 3-like isoform X1 n=2 Tax=Anopheles stephensi TaxID=30069 RepID=UPI001658B51E|nr:leucine-rich repeat neuronal protein 3-like isoform X1 [Anopheles stephensi]
MRSSVRQKCCSNWMFILATTALLQAFTSGFVFAVDVADQNTTIASTVTSAENSTKTTASILQTSNLCQNCNCKVDFGIFDCSNRKIDPQFSPDDWQSLSTSEFDVKSVLLVSTGMKEVTQFPSMNVTLLDLSHNEIATIESKCFMNLTLLQVLDLSHNRLKSEALTPDIFVGHYSPNEYVPMKHLRVLRLSANELHSLNQDLFENLPSLEELSLDLNPFKVIDQQSEIAIASIDRLVSLDLSYMELEDIPKYLFHTPQRLQYLNLTGNLLQIVPPALTYAKGLKWLSVDENPISSIVVGTEFPSLKQLTFLSLSYMTQLRVIGRGAFSGLEALEEIHITNNPHLSFIHGHAFMRNDTDNPERFDWSPIKRLYLHNNNISYLDAQLLVQWDSMEVIDIRVNPWACDCSNRWVLLSLLPIIERTTPAILNNIDCNSPPQMAGLSMVDLEHKHTHMRCPDGAGNNPSNDGALLMGLLIGVLLAIPFTAAIWCVYKRGCFGLFGRGNSTAYSRAFYSRTTLNEEF